MPQEERRAARAGQQAGGRADAAGPARRQVRAALPTRGRRAGRAAPGLRHLRTPRCCHGDAGRRRRRAVRAAAGLQDREVRADAEPARGAAAPPAAARRAGLRAGVRPPRSAALLRGSAARARNRTRAARSGDGPQPAAELRAKVREGREFGDALGRGRAAGVPGPLR